jgi:hypothetical protein
MTDPQLNRDGSDAINDRIRDAAGKNPGDVVLARDVHQFIASQDAEIAAIVSDRDGLKRQIDWLAEWLTEHTDEPKGSYGAVEAAINAMAGFQRHIDRSAEVWARNRQDLEKLRAENTAQAKRIDEALGLHKPVMFAWTKVDGTVVKEFGNYCEHCASLCHSSSGMSCDEPMDGAWPCATARALGVNQEGTPS